MSYKSEFLNTEIWLLTFGGAFQRANIYRRNTNEKDRKEFREGLSHYIDDNLLQKYKEDISDNEHLKNIDAVIKFTQHYDTILNNGRIKFGVAQKVLNLYLKYQWCLGNIQMPPHFPIDRIIQKKMKHLKIINWTTMDEKEDYLTIINFAKTLAKKDQRIAEWELINFSRKNIN